MEQERQNVVMPSHLSCYRHRAVMMIPGCVKDLYTSTYHCNLPLLQLSILLAPFLCDLLLSKLPCLALQHLDLLVKRKFHLVAHRYETLGDVLVVLSQQIDCEEEVVDVVKDNCLFIRVLLLLRQEGNWVLAPVAERVEVMRGVVAIVVTVSVALS